MVKLYICSAARNKKCLWNQLFGKGHCPDSTPHERHSENGLCCNDGLRHGCGWGTSKPNAKYPRCERVTRTNPKTRQ